MKRKMISALALSLFVCGVLLVSAATVAATSPALQEAQKPEQSISGKILSVQDGGFTLEYTDTAGAPKKANFTVNGETKVSGKLEAGKVADVTYRAENNRWIAVNVTINSTQ